MHGLLLTALGLLPPGAQRVAPCTNNLYFPMNETQGRRIQH